MHGILIRRVGGPEVLEWAERDDPAAVPPRPGHIVVDVAAVGVNFIDTYLRSGLYPSEPPFTPGSEGAGVVTATAPDVDHLRPGDRVAWADVAGSYAQRMTLPADRAVPVPEGVTLDQAAAVMLQGLTAHYLVHDTFVVRPGVKCLVHAGAGGVGLLLIQMVKLLGGEVFATVGAPEKARLARHAGADHVIEYREPGQEDFAAVIESIAGAAHPLDVVYDGVGRATFAGGLRTLRRRGLMVSFGNASGAPAPMSPLILSQHGSLYLTRPTLADYIVTTEQLRARAEALFALVAGGRLSVRIGTRLPLEAAGEAHRLLESRSTTGKVLLLP